jgi:hypothetical protein
MARSRRLALLAIGSAAIAACNVIAGIDQFHDVPCEACEAGTSLPEASPLPLEAGPDTTTDDAGVDAADADAADAPDSQDAADATLDAGTDADADATSFVPPEASADYRWPRWTMPNGAQAGLPNAASYAPVPGTDGGVLDLVTDLRWTDVQTAMSLNAALSACTYPARLPTRIELVSILDTSQPYVLVNPAFTTMHAAGPVTYWSSSMTPDGQRWTVDFGGGFVQFSHPGTAVICVQLGDGGAP